MEAVKIYNLVILDESGSMHSIYQQALTGVNETIQTIRRVQQQHDEMEQNLTLVAFSAGERYLNTIYFNTPIGEVEEITEKQYQPGGCTALYDAMGEMITRIQEVKHHDDKVLVTVITDGFENASQKWSAAGIKSLVDELRHMGWTFTYIGANQDSVEEAAKIGVRNAMNFGATAEGTRAMFRKDSKARSSFMDTLAMKLKSPSRAAQCNEEAADYFKEG